jgi:hypothetical protein
VPGEPPYLLPVALGSQGGGQGFSPERARGFPAHAALGKGQARDEPFGVTEKVRRGGTGGGTGWALAPGQASRHGASCAEVEAGGLWP